MPVRTQEPFTGIGTAGQLGFGVGVCDQPALLDRHQITAMDGYDDINSPNYGNYIHQPSQSILVWIPAFKYLFDQHAPNKVTISSPNQVTQKGASLHRAFLDDNVKKSGFFVDKYICSLNDQNQAVSVKNGSICSLTNNSRYGKISGNVEGCQGILGDAITLSRARGEGFQALNLYQLGALRLLTLAHAQTSTSNDANAWYDEQPKIPEDKITQDDIDDWKANRINQRHNLPRAANNSHRDQFRDDAQWATDPLFKARSLTGSCNPFGKCTHNGQDNGVADLTGIVYQIAIGYMGQGRFVNNKIAIADYDLQSLYADDNGDRSHYRTFTLPFDGWHAWDGDQKMFDNGLDPSELVYNCAGSINVVTKTGDNHQQGMFDHQYQYILDQPDTIMYYGCNELHGNYYRTGLFYNDTYFKYYDRAEWIGFRASLYL